MLLPESRSIAKVLVAALALAVLALVAGHNLAPGVAWWHVLLWAAAAAATVLSILGMLAWLMGTWNRFTLRHGGADAQWMWWGSEPPGLQRERDKAEASAARDADPLQTKQIDLPQDNHGD